MCSPWELKAFPVLFLLTLHDLVLALKTHQELRLHPRHPIDFDQNSDWIPWKFQMNSWMIFDCSKVSWYWNYLENKKIYSSFWLIFLMIKWKQGMVSCQIYLKFIHSMEAKKFGKKNLPNYFDVTKYLISNLTGIFFSNFVVFSEYIYCTWMTWSRSGSSNCHWKSFL